MQRNPRKVHELERSYRKLQNDLDKSHDYESAAKAMTQVFHNEGHTIVAENCKTSRKSNGMAFSHVSARDPIFYRWHGHCEDLLQQYRDRKLAPYSYYDFNLGDGVRVIGVRTHFRDTDGRHQQNKLITYNERASIQYSEHSDIIYNRVNHVDFRFQVMVRNPRNIRKKVIIRLWLGLPEDKKWMIEMDRFVVRLNGNTKQIITRQSQSNAATMKHQLETWTESVLVF